MKFELPSDYKLPVFPKIIRECLVYMYKPDADVALMAKSLAQDIGVSASILKMANSALFSLGKGAPTADLKIAITRIGHDNLRQIMLLHALENTVYFEEIGFFNFKSFCRHASFTSVVCTEFSKKVAPKFATDLQMAGLMHDVGLSILANLFPEKMAQLVKFCLQNGVDFSAAEEKLGFEPHRELGARVMASWDIPQEVIEIIYYHDIKQEEERSKLKKEHQLLTEILILADILAHSYSFGYNNYVRDNKIEPSQLKRIGLSSDDVKVTVKVSLEIVNSIKS